MGTGIPAVAEGGCQQGAHRLLSVNPLSICPVGENYFLNPQNGKLRHMARQVRKQESWVLKAKGWESTILGPDLCHGLQEQPKAPPPTLPPMEEGGVPSGLPGRGGTRLDLKE